MAKLIDLTSALRTTKRLKARLIPYGETVEWQGEAVRFTQGNIKLPVSVPLSLDHGKGVLERIGLVTDLQDRPDGLYGRLTISDTANGRDAATLLADKVLTDVSAGVALDSWEMNDSGSLTGELDHTAIVQGGAFGKAGAGSKVLAASERRPEVAKDAKPAEGNEDDGQLAEMASELSDLREAMAEFVAAATEGEGKKIEPKPFEDIRDFVLTLAAASSGDRAATEKMAEFALADDTTTTAIGVVPDALSQRVIEIIDASRPYIDSLRKDPIGDHGMSVVYPKVISGPSVAVQATQKTEVDSTAMDIDPVSYPLLTYAGASDVARQLVERSQPSFVEILFRHYANAYAQQTDGDAFAAGVAGAGGTAVLADLGADAALTFAAVGVANAAIIAGTRKPATHWGLGATRWAELNSLVDADGRPLLVFPDNGPMNAQGQAGFTNLVGQYHGLIAYLEPNAVVTTDLLYNSEFAFTLESATQQLRAEVVSLLGFEMGVYGLFAHAIEHADGGYKFTLV